MLSAVSKKEQRSVFFRVAMWRKLLDSTREAQNEAQKRREPNINIFKFY